MNLATLFVVYAALLAASCLALFIAFRQNKEERALKSWAIGTLLAVVGLFAIAIYNLYNLSDSFWLFDIIGNICSYTGIALYYIGTKQFLRQKIRLAATLAVLLLACFTIIFGEHIYWRVLMGSLVLTYFSSLIFVSLMITASRRTATGYFLGGYFAIFALVNIIRAWQTFIEFNLNFYPRMIDKLMIFTGIIGSGVIVLGFILLTTEKLNRRLRKLVTLDPLTSVLNRRGFYQVTEPVIARAIRDKALIGLAIFDLDFFKRINDTHGHLQGDQVLAKFAHIAEKIFRRHDIFARIGGEEFVLLTTHLDPCELKVALERLRTSLADYWFGKNISRFQLTVSIGAYITRANASYKLETALEGADKALYQAKAGGRDQIVFSRAQRLFSVTPQAI